MPSSESSVSTSILRRSINGAVSERISGMSPHSSTCDTSSSQYCLTYRNDCLNSRASQSARSSRAATAERLAASANPQCISLPYRRNPLLTMTTADSDAPSATYAWTAPGTDERLSLACAHNAPHGVHTPSTMKPASRTGRNLVWMSSAAAAKKDNSTSCRAPAAPTLISRASRPSTDTPCCMAMLSASFARSAGRRTYRWLLRTSHNVTHAWREKSPLSASSFSSAVRASAPSDVPSVSKLWTRSNDRSPCFRQRLLTLASTTVQRAGDRSIPVRRIPGLSRNFGFARPWR